MPRNKDSPGARLRAAWRRLSPLPGGRWLFSRLLGGLVPYTATIRVTVEHFEPGAVRIRMPDRRRVRNHLRSIHAVALANVGELATGLALVGALGEDARAILVRLETTYTKKARGTVVAEADCTVPDTVRESVERVVTARVSDDSGDLVSTTHATWRVSPARERT